MAAARTERAVKEVVEHALLHVNEHGPRLECSDGPSTVPDGQDRSGFPPAVDILKEGAERIVVAPAGVVCSVLA